MTSTVRYNHSGVENNLDALLEDLQTTVAGTNKITNGHVSPAPGMTSTGYREVMRSVATQRDGQPTESSKEYHIEYLNPANSTTVISESLSPNFNSLERRSESSSANQNLNSYKTVSYQYNTSGSSSTARDIIKSSNTDNKLRQNINELDSLLDDINLAQKTGFANSGGATYSTPKKPSGYEVKERIESTSTPRGHVSRIEERTFEEQRYGTVLPPRTDSETRRELKFVGNSSRDNSLSRTIRDQSPSPVRSTKEVFYQETKSSSSGRSRDNRSPSPIRNQNLIAANNGKVASTVKSYDYRSQTSNAAQEIGRSLRERTPSPTGAKREIIRYDYEKTTTRSVTPPRVVHHYDYQTTSSSTNEKSYARPASPVKYQSYEYQKTTSNAKETPRTPPPHRSPSPVSFAQPPDPHVSSSVSYNSFEKGISRSSPIPAQKFSPSDPSRSPPPTVITYKYSSTSTESKKYPPTVTHHYESEESRKYDKYESEKPRPFPVTEADKLPPTSDQKPPRHVDELMASFSESDYQQRFHSIDSPDSSKPVTPAPPPPPETPCPNPAPQANGSIGKSKNVAGPPVYYPPGELFTKREESMQQSAGGKMKGKAMGKYKYKEGSKYMEKSGTTAIPVCLPLCCAGPCVIM